MKYKQIEVPLRIPSHHWYISWLCLAVWFALRFEPNRQAQKTDKYLAAAGCRSMEQ